MRTNKLFKQLILAVSLCSYTLSSFADTPASSTTATSDDLCTASGYTLGFFNGVFNTYAEAQSGLAAIYQLRRGNSVLVGATNGDTFGLRHEPVQYELFYNSSGAESGSGSTRLQDVMEVFTQRANEIDPSGKLAKHKELVWEVIQGNTPLLNKLSALSSQYTSLITQMQDIVNTKAVGAIASLVSNPPTQADYAKHNARLDALALQKQKLMLVAHSQGNLFMNKAYEHILPTVGASSVKVVHIAPASATLHGKYWLAAIDLIINGLRSTGNVPSISDELNVVILPPSLKDWTGHKLINTYLDPNRGARNFINLSITDAMNQLVTPSTEGNQGAFTVTLTWDGSGDVDLHTFEPNNGSHVYYSNSQGQVGRLDIDNRIANGPEHYFASCDPNILQTGNYSIGINNYAGATGRIATVQVATSSKGVIFTKVLGVGAENGSNGDQHPIPVVKVSVNKDASTGKFDISVPVSDILNPL